LKYTLIEIMTNSMKQGDIIQLIGVLVMGFAIGVELCTKAEAWCVVITIGSILFALGTKIKGA